VRYVLAAFAFQPDCRRIHAEDLVDDLIQVREVQDHFVTNFTELLQSVHDLLVQLVLNLGILGQDIGRVGQGRGRGFEPGQQKDVRLQFQTTDKEEKAFLKSTPVTVGTSFKAT